MIYLLIAHVLAHVLDQNYDAEQQKDADRHCLVDVDNHYSGIHSLLIPSYSVILKSIACKKKCYLAADSTCFRDLSSV